jgi:hypothetical protein
LQSTFDGYCHADATCVHATDEGDGITRFYDEERDVLCRGGTDPGSTCTCRSDDHFVTFQRESLVESIDDCNDYVERCSFDAFELEGQATCTEVEGAATASYCYASLSCSHGAKLAGEAVTVLGHLDATCNEAGGGWSCECRSTTRRITVEVTAADAAGACAEARVACPEAVPVLEWSGP